MSSRVFGLRPAAVAALVVTLSVSAASAESKRRSISGDFSGIEDLFSSSTRSELHASTHSFLQHPIRFSGYVAGTGRIRGKLNVQRHTTWDPGNSDYVLLQGEGDLLSNPFKEEIPAFGTLLKSKRSGDFLLRLFLPTASRSRSAEQRLSEFRLNLRKVDGTFKVVGLKRTRSSKRLENTRSCGSPTYGASSSSAQRSQITTQATLRVTRLTMDADTEYANRIGTDLGTEMASVLNGVETIYRRDLGVTFQANVISVPQAYSSAIVLDQNFAFPIHEEMAQKVEPSTRDMHVLLTGKDPVGQDISGLAGAVPDLGAVCRNPALAVGFTIRWQDSGFSATTQDDIITTAHEVGHSFGGEHDDAQTAVNNRGIMHSGTTNVDNDITAFSSFSQNQIGNFIAQSGSCLGTTEGDRGVDNGGSGVEPVAGLGSILARKRRNRIIFRTFDTDGFRLGEVALNILCTADLEFLPFESYGVAATNRRGILRVRGSRGLSCKASSGAIESNVVSLKRRGRKRRGRN